jgi:hypothetical protein
MPSLEKNSPSLQNIIDFHEDFIEHFMEKSKTLMQTFNCQKIYHPTKNRFSSVKLVMKNKSAYITSRIVLF